MDEYEWLYRRVGACIERALCIENDDDGDYMEWHILTAEDMLRLSPNELRAVADCLEGVAADDKCKVCGKHSDVEVCPEMLLHRAVSKLLVLYRGESVQFDLTVSPSQMKSACAMLERRGFEVIVINAEIIEIRR